MAPLKASNKMNIQGNGNVKMVTRTRSGTHLQIKEGVEKIERIVRGKRKASPSKENSAAKRTALGDLTANVVNKIVDSKGTKNIKKVTVQSKVLPSVRTVLKPKQNNENLAPPPAPAGNKIVTRAKNKHQVLPIPNQTALKSKEVVKETSSGAATKKRLSNEFEKTENEPSLYSTALEDTSKKSLNWTGKTRDNDTIYYSARKSTRSNSKSSVESCSSPKSAKDKSERLLSNVSLVVRELETKLNLGNHTVPQGVDDYDKENWKDIFQVSHYAMDVFNYYKEREKLFPLGDYMERQICLTKWMRSLLVDWMVEIQESFELNHETLYLGVKLVDMYLDRVTVSKETLQLVGAAAMFVASKFDERIPPMIDDFLYICDGAYNRREMIRMEMNLLKVVDFNLGIPISYRFLRRYARCAKITMPVLTLARYILELALMDYETIHVKDSLLGSAALYIALRMKKVSDWTPTLEFYTTYNKEDIKKTALLLNQGLHRPAKSQLMTVRNKYSHKIFFEVAKTPLIPDAHLF